MPNKSVEETSLINLSQEKRRLEKEVESIKSRCQASVLEKLKIGSYSRFPSVFDKSGQFKSSDMYFAYAGGIKHSLDKFENYQSIDFCYKRGVRLVIESGMSSRIASGGGSDLYGICIDYDNFTKTATVISIASNFECVLLSDSSIKAGDNLVFDSLGVLKKVHDNDESDDIQALALSDALEFKDKPGLYGAKIMLISRPLYKSLGS
ncbi:DUF228 domain-containing protein [Pseudomonas aeruginosa]|nr:DUF228 domain-containing protein [Pseudomonas aeruginosa]